MDTLEKRLPAVDLLKVVAAQLIVLHHMAAYGPISEAVQEAWPELVSWFHARGRMAVQVFLVLGGYLAARTFFPAGRPHGGNHAAAVANRYLRLAVPFLAALVLAVACAALARLFMDDDFIPGAPSLLQALAHLLLLQSLLEYESLTAGAWYVAIDFQLFAAIIGLSWLARRTGAAGALPAVAFPGLVVATMIASLFWFNLDSRMDAWAIYFFGAYGMGAATHWALSTRKSLAWLVALTGLVAAALAVEFRGRVAVALAMVAILGLAACLPRLKHWAVTRELRPLADISYALFLVQFPVLMVANVLFAELEQPDAFDGIAAMIATWLASLAVATVFHRWVEVPAGRLRLPRSLRSDRDVAPANRRRYPDPGNIWRFSRR